MRSSWGLFSSVTGADFYTEKLSSNKQNFFINSSCIADGVFQLGKLTAPLMVLLSASVGKHFGSTPAGFK